jgi:hypothetical protein
MTGALACKSGAVAFKVRGSYSDGGGGEDTSLAGDSRQWVVFHIGI